MRKIEKRAALCLLLAIFLALGLGVFCFQYVTRGGDWASYPFNRHMYNNSGQLISGAIYDRDGDVLTEVADGKRTYYPDATVRRATLHAVGDRSSIATVRCPMRRLSLRSGRGRKARTRATRSRFWCIGCARHWRPAVRRKTWNS